MNIEKLKALLPREYDSALIISPVNRRYFTGFEASDGFLLVTRSNAVFFTDSRYIEAAEKAIDCCEVRLGTDAYPQIAEILREAGITRMAVEASYVTLSQYGAISGAPALEGVKMIGDNSLDEIINRLRCVKSEEEVGRILRAQKIAEDALDHVLGILKPGMTENEVRLALEYHMLSHGAQALSFETIAVSGVNSSMPHGVPSDKVIEEGDFVTMDFGAMYGGYHSDMTRTVAVGRATDEMRKIYSTVLEAQFAGLESLRPGLSCLDADAAARDVIAKAGYGEYFGHGTGHGVGTEIHEHPFVSPRSKETLAEGNVVTVEPGIYIPGKFGVRIEDMALITADGHRGLTASPKELIVV